MTTRHSQALLSLAFVGLLHGMIHTFSIFLSPLNAEIAAYFHAESISAITSLKTTYLVTYAVSNLFFGAMTNRISTRLILSCGMILNSLAFLLFFLVPPDGLPAMHGLWLLAAIGGGVYHPVANAFITRLFPDRKGWAIGITGMGSGMGFAFGPLLTGILSGPAGLDWSRISFIFGLAGMVLGALAYVAIRDVPHPETKRGERTGGTGLTLGLGIFMVVVILVAGIRDFAMWSIQDVSDFFLARLFSGKANTAWYLFLLNLPGIVVQPLAGSWSDRIGRNRLGGIALAFYGAAIASLAFLPSGLLFLPYLLMGVGQSATIPTIEAMVADYATPRTRGIMFGLFITSLTAIGALGPLLSGLFLDGFGRTLEAFRQWMFVLGAVVLVGSAAMAAMPRLVRVLRIEKHHD